MNELYHHGIKNQKWGVRRYQNEDGSYTEEGRKRYGIGAERSRSTAKSQQTYLNDLQKTIAYDKTKARHYRDNSEYSTKVANQFRERAAKKEAKGKDPSKMLDGAAKYDQLAKEHKAAQESYEKQIEKAEKETLRAITALSSQGYQVSEKQTTYATRRINSLMYRDKDTEHRWHGAMGGAVGGAMVGLSAYENGVKQRGSISEALSREKGTKYKVKSGTELNEATATLQKGASIAGNTLAKGITKGVTVGANVASKGLTKATGVVNKGFQKGTEAAKDWTDEEYKKRVRHSDEEASITTNWVKVSENSLMHYQVKGAKHGLRRYQNPDGTLTPLGRIHYGVGDPRARRHQEREYKRAERASEKAARKERVTLAKEGVAAGKARAKWESMSDEDKLKVYDKNLKKSRDLRYKKSKEEAEKANAKAKEAEAQKEDSKKNEPEKQPSKREQKQEQKKAADREEQIKKDTEKIKEAIKTESQNEPAQKERKPISAADYKDTASMLQTTSANLSSMKDLVNVIEGARQRNAVRNAVGERKLSKPISEMSDKEINDIVNRWALEDRIASASVGAKSKAAENVTTALDVVGNLTLQSSRAFSIASNIRSIVERR